MAKPVRAVERAVKILIYLNGSNGSNSNQVARGTGLSRGTAYRMLETLAAEGLVEMPQPDGRYWLTRKVRQLADGFDDEEWISTVARPEMRGLTEAIAWPAMLTTAAGINMILRATTDTQTSLVFRRYPIGHAVPILGSATGRCYLAYCSASRRSALLDLIPRLAPEPWAGLVANKAGIDKLLSGIRNRRICLAPAPDGISTGVAVPILVEGEPRAVLAMRYFKTAMNEAEAMARFADPLHRWADRIGARWRAECGR
jgi:IclR family mhp operon transcriptional activator